MIKEKKGKRKKCNCDLELTSAHVVMPNKIFNKYNENMYKMCIQLVFMHVVGPIKISNKYNENM